MPISQELKQSLRERALYANAPTITANTNGDYSFGIVNSESNGKRVSISKSLSIKLELTDNLAILPMIDDGVVPLPGYQSCKYSRQGEKNCLLRIAGPSSYRSVRPGLFRPHVDVLQRY